MLAKPKARVIYHTKSFGLRVYISGQISKLIRKTYKGIGRAKTENFCFVLIQLKEVLCHPVLNVHKAFDDAIQPGLVGIEGEI